MFHNRPNFTYFSQSLDIKNKFALILTATISVDNIPKAYPSDKNVREQQYMRTLRYYLCNYPDLRKIIFIENSASSLDNLQQLVLMNNLYQKEIEFISLDTNLYHSQKGKGFGECLLLQEGLSKSQLIKNVTHFGKVTGRIILRNIMDIMKTIPANFDCICDYKDQGYKVKNILFNQNKSPFCDTRFIAFSKNFYQQNLVNLHINFLANQPNSYFCIESEYFKKIKSLENQSNIIKRFKIEPKFQGISGHTGSKKYGGKNYNSPYEKIKFHIRNFLRKILPVLHL
ncbi:MAG: hypothetical protein IGQ45_05660 [Cyanobacterium sp. T60_A2020_053]|nr:hypothetical protein [Cyanobacterium sp. T60_A2020_053]